MHADGQKRLTQRRREGAVGGSGRSAGPVGRAQGRLGAQGAPAWVPPGGISSRSQLRMLESWWQNKDGAARGPGPGVDSLRSAPPSPGRRGQVAEPRAALTEKRCPCEQLTRRLRLWQGRAWGRRRALCFASASVSLIRSRLWQVLLVPLPWATLTLTQPEQSGGRPHLPFSGHSPCFPSPKVTFSLTLHRHAGARLPSRPSRARESRTGGAVAAGSLARPLCSRGGPASHHLRGQRARSS